MFAEEEIDRMLQNRERELEERLRALSSGDSRTDGWMVIGVPRKAATIVLA
jgi:hypothetical protein